MEQNAQVLIYDETTGKAIGGFYSVFRELSGYPEYVLKRALVIVLREAGLVVREEVQLPVMFRGRHLTTFRADLIIDPGIIVEVKTAPEIAAYQKAQLLHYLKASNLEVGLLFNFGRRPQFARVVYQSARKESERPDPAQPDADPSFGESKSSASRDPSESA
jgi:GxxExxY protein